MTVYFMVLRKKVVLTGQQQQQQTEVGLLANMFCADGRRDKNCLTRSTACSRYWGSWWRVETQMLLHSRLAAQLSLKPRAQATCQVTHLFLQNCSSLLKAGAKTPSPDPSDPPTCSSRTPGCC